MKTALAIFVSIWCLGCSSAAPEEPAPAGKAPEVKTMEPGMKSPEERARMATGGGEGS